MGAESGSCGIESLCPTRVNWRTINDAITVALKSVTIADMAAPSFPPPQSDRAESSWHRA
jgi:DNA-binding IscR family transcriptional regulator